MSTGLHSRFPRFSQYELLAQAAVHPYYLVLKIFLLVCVLQLREEGMSAFKFYNVVVVYDGSQYQYHTQ